jgi:hypothetical protein
LALGDRFVDRLGAAAEGVGQTVDLGDRHGGDRADHVRLGQLAGDHAAQISRLVDPVVEHAEVRLGRAEAGAEDESDLRVLLGDPSGNPLGAEGIAHDQVVAALGVFVQHAGEVGRLDALRPGVLDAELLFGLQQRHVDLVDPGLLDRRFEDGGDLELLFGRGRVHDQAQDGRDRHGRRDHAAPSHLACLCHALISLFP